MDTLKVLAQASPSVGILTDFYTVPVLTQTTVSSIVICNLGVVGSSFNIAIAINGIVDSPQQYIYYNMPISTNDTFIATIGMSLAAGDKIRISAGTNNISFNMFGVEIS